jgi:hypothetical protein
MTPRIGREATLSAAVLDSQSIKSAVKGAAKTTKWPIPVVRGVYLTGQIVSPV